MLKLEHILNKYIKLNNIILVVIISLLLLSFIIGIINAIFIDEKMKQDLVGYVNNILQYHSMDVSQVQIFLTMFWARIKIFLILWCLGMTVLGIVVTPIFIIIEGFCSGLSTYFIISSISTIEQWQILLISLFFKLAIIIPILILFSISTINFPLYLIKNDKMEDLKFKIIGNCVVFLISAVLISISVILELYIGKFF